MEFDIQTVLWIVLIIVGILGLIFAFSKKQKINNFNKWIFVVPLFAVVAVLGLYNLGYLEEWGFLTGTLAVSPPTPGATNIPQEGVCANGFTLVDNACVCLTTDGSTTVTMSAVDEYTTAAVGGSHKYRINGNPSSIVADGGTFTASPGDSLEILWANESTTGYFNKIEKVVVPCAGTRTFSSNLVSNGTLTMKFYNTDDNKIDGLSVNQSLSAGDTKTLKATFEGQYQKAYPYGFVAVIEYNKSSMDDVILQDSNGVELSKQTIPQSFSMTYGIDSASKGFLVSPQISSSDLNLKVVIDVDDSVSPGAAAADDIKLKLYSRQNYVDDKNGGVYVGPSAEDEYNVLVRDSNEAISGTLYVE